MVTKVLGGSRLGAGALGTYPSAVLTAPVGLALVSKMEVSPPPSLLTKPEAARRGT